MFIFIQLNKEINIVYKMSFKSILNVKSNKVHVFSDENLSDILSDYDFKKQIHITVAPSP